MAGIGTVDWYYVMVRSLPMAFINSCYPMGMPSAEYENRRESRLL